MNIEHCSCPREGQRESWGMKRLLEMMGEDGKGVFTVVRVLA